MHAFTPPHTDRHTHTQRERERERERERKRERYLDTSKLQIKQHLKQSGPVKLCERGIASNGNTPGCRGRAVLL
jgi:hypothetical protein